MNKASYLSAEESLINRLKESPLFNLSLASKELFHSNFLQWYGLNYKKDFGIILSNFFNIDDALTVVTIEREKSNIDLLIDCKCDADGSKGVRIVIENKIKSMPREDQLRDYEKKVKADYYCILSFAEPIQDLRNNCESWSFVSYERLLDCVRYKVVNISSDYHRSLVTDYVDFTSVLFQLMKSTLSSEFYNIEGNKLLNELRIYDLISKSLASSLAKELLETYPTSSVISGNFIPGNLEKDRIYVEFGFTNGTALISIYHTVESRESDEIYFAGIQVQGDSFRICGYSPIVGLKDRGASEFMNWLCGNVWDKKQLFELNGSVRDRKNAYDPEYLQYSSIQGTEVVGMFLYKQMKLPRKITKKELLEKVKYYFDPVKENLSQLPQKGHRMK